VTQAPPEAPAPDAQPTPDPQATESAASRAVRNTVEWIVIIAGALVLAFIVKTFLLQAFVIPSASMDPELRVGDRVLVNKLSYRVHDVHRGDIAVFSRPACDVSDPAIKDLIKRVVGVGGDTVEASDGHVLVNGKRLDESYLPPGVTTTDFGPVHVPKGHLWMMGDNRNNSKDSRILCNNAPTYIDEDTVVGRAFVRMWPLGSLTLL
jgi:signal peptidase I